MMIPDDFQVRRGVMGFWRRYRQFSGLCWKHCLGPLKLRHEAYQRRTLVVVIDYLSTLKPGAVVRWSDGWGGYRVNPVFSGWIDVQLPDLMSRYPHNFIYTVDDHAYVAKCIEEGTYDDGGDGEPWFSPFKIDVPYNTTYHVVTRVSDSETLLVIATNRGQPLNNLQQQAVKAVQARHDPSDTELREVLGWTEEVINDGFKKWFKEHTGRTDLIPRYYAEAPPSPAHQDAMDAAMELEQDHPEDE